MWVHRVPVGLGHLAAISTRDEPMNHDALRQREASAHEHGGPDHRVEPADVLAHNVHVRRPEAAQRFGRVRAVNAADVIDERLKPHVHHMLLPIHLVLRARHAPVEGASADGQVAHLHRREPLDDLAAVLRRLDELRVLLKVLQHGLLVLGLAEEEARLGHLLQRRTRSRVLEVPLLCLLVGDEALLPDQIPAFVAVQVDVAHLPALPPDDLGNGLVSVGGGADVKVVGHTEPLVQSLEARAVAVADLYGLQVLLLGLLRDLLAVLVGARHEEDVLAQQPVVPREDVGGQRLVGVAHVRPAVAVADGCGDVVAALGAGIAAGRARRTCSWPQLLQRRHPAVLHGLWPAVHLQLLLLLARRAALLRGGLRRLVCLAPLVSGGRPLVVLGELRTELGDLLVPAQEVRELLPIWLLVDAAEDREVLRRGLAGAANEGTIGQERVELGKPLLRPEAANRDRRCHRPPLQAAGPACCSPPAVKVQRTRGPRSADATGGLIQTL
mmetsp:Transcript_92134/g.256695  ORF Transcript_92134/g.256695 Transcript_92134/m.256695 type:complete len:498 (+) Transcript_92134:1323-2816(+)